MSFHKIDGITIEADEDITDELAGEYLAWARKRYPDMDVSNIMLQFDGDYVNTTVFPKRNVPFERIRRITGYLVGDRDTRFNDAKLAEERERVKHSIKRN